jgi:hypothetical protein
MHAALSNNLFFVKEHAGIFKAANNYDIFEPHSQQKILECREPNLGFFSKLLRFTDYSTSSARKSLTLVCVGPVTTRSPSALK